MATFNGDWDQWLARQDAPRRARWERPAMSVGARERATFRNPAPASLPNGRRMASRYPGVCASCGQRFPEGTEIWYDFDARKATHVTCPERAATPAPVARPEPTPIPETEHADEPREGTYTVVMGGTHRTFKVRRQPEDRDFMPGRLLVSYLSGADNEGDYTRFAHIADGRLRVWKRFASDSLLARMAEVLLNPEAAKAAGLAYAMESGNCYVCGRKLTVPASICAGIGPVCSGRE